MFEINDTFFKEYKYISSPIQQEKQDIIQPWLNFSKQNTNNYKLYERSEDENSCIYKASDNQEYNIKELFITQLTLLLNSLKKQDCKQKSDTEKFFDNTIQKLKIGIQKNNLEQYITDTISYIQNTPELKNIFEQQTGKEFSQQNIENFLKGKLNLTLEKEYRTATGDSFEKSSNPPFLKSDWQTNFEKNNLKKQRKHLNDKEKISYAKIYDSLDKEMKTKLDNCLNSGKLLQTEPNSKRTVLDSLYKILTVPRTANISNIKILNECINILDNPLIITQITEDIPDDYIESVAENIYRHQTLRDGAKHSKNMQRKIIENKDDKLIRIKNELKDRGVGTCVAASIEFYLASKHPAEFVRIVEGLTSQKREVKKYLDCRKANLTGDTIEYFNTNYKVKNGFLEISLRADENAYFLAEMQEEYQDNFERTTVDILMQSLCFQIASGNTYNSITDTFYNIDKEYGGLCDFEEQYVLQILTGNNVVNIDFTAIDENMNILFQTDKNKIEKYLDDALEKGKYIIIGIDNVYYGNAYDDGHEITIIGKTKSLDGNEYYICKDTGLEFARPVLINKDYIFNHIFACKTIE